MLGTVRSVAKKLFTLESVSKVMVVTYWPHIRCLAMKPSPGKSSSVHEY
jgi:hypothetical protein